MALRHYKIVESTKDGDLGVPLGPEEFSIFFFFLMDGSRSWTSVHTKTLYMPSMCSAMRHALSFFSQLFCVPVPRVHPHDQGWCVDFHVLVLGSRVGDWVKKGTTY